MSLSMTTVERVLAYITQGDRLLVFSHPHYPEAGLQVPGGRIEEGETPLDAVLREAHEETSLSDLVVRSCLGVREYDLRPYGRNEIERRHFFHLEFRGQAPATWRHCEMHPSDGSEAPIELEFFWVRLPDNVPELIAGQGDLLASIEPHCAIRTAEK
jgi:8-oxo-dGTP diphosphatase